MPGAVTPADTFDNVTSVSDGDGANATNFKAAIQQLTNRTQWLSNRMGSGLVANFADLRAIDTATLINGERRYVQGYGFYEYRASDTAAEVVPWIIDPTSVGNGRWYNTLSSIAPYDTIFPSSGRGIATLGSNGRVQQVPANAEVASAYIAAVANFATTSTTDVAVTGTTTADIGPPTVVSDRVYIDLTALVDAAADSNIVSIQDNENGAGWVTIAESSFTVASGRTDNYARCIRKTIATAGTYQVRVVIHSVGGAGVSITVKALRIRIVRL